MGSCNFWSSQGRQGPSPARRGSGRAEAQRCLVPGCQRRTKPDARHTVLQGLEDGVAVLATLIFARLLQALGTCDINTRTNAALVSTPIFSYTFLICVFRVLMLTVKSWDKA